MQTPSRPATTGRNRAALFAALCCALCVCGASFAARAQSGRRQQKPVEIAPVPTPSPEPTPLPPPPPADPIQLMLLSDDSQLYGRADDYSRLMRDAVAQRVREAKAFDATGGSKSATRGEANKLARQETKRFVVWFRLVLPGASGLPDISGSEREPEIEFVVLEPATGKQRSSGRVYLGSRRVGIGRGGIGLPGGRFPGGGGSCYPTGMTREGYYVVEAAIEAADRVIREFGVAVPPRCS